MKFNIRPENLDDEAAIYALTQTAFAAMPYSDGREGAIINALRRDGDLVISLVAVEGENIIGHIAFSKVTIDGKDQGWFGLGPVSADPDYQGQGIGSALIHEGLARLKALGVKGCALIGDPKYYHRFGFVSGGLTYQNLPSELVQYRVLEGGAPKGELRFCPAFES